MEKCEELCWKHRLSPLIPIPDKQLSKGMTPAKQWVYLLLVKRTKHKPHCCLPTCRMDTASPWHSPALTSRPLGKGLGGIFNTLHTVTTQRWLEPLQRQFHSELSAFSKTEAHCAGGTGTLRSAGCEPSPAGKPTHYGGKTQQNTPELGHVLCRTCRHCPLCRALLL